MQDRDQPDKPNPFKHNCGNCNNRIRLTSHCNKRNTDIETPDRTCCSDWAERKPMNKEELLLARGTTLEALKTVFDVAMQHEPRCEERWKALLEVCKYALKQEWKRYDAEMEESHE